MIYSQILTFLHTNPLVTMIYATICGMLIGIEREVNHKPAGVRTCALVCLGSALFTFLSHYGISSYADSDSSRIASQVVSGIGFLGAGVILVDRRSRVIGLTTAAAIWVVAAIGMAIGYGFNLLALQTTLLTVSIMFGIGHLERQFVSKIDVLKKRRAK